MTQSFASRFAAPFLVLTSVSATALAGDVLVIDDDGGPGVDFTTLTQAVANAPDGSILLVRGGTYVAPTIERSITMTAENGFTPELTGELVIQNLAATDVVHMASFCMLGAEDLVTIRNNSGVVRFIDALFPSFVVGEDGDAKGPRVIVESSKVRFERMLIGGIQSNPPTTPTSVSGIDAAPDAVLHVTTSDVRIYASEFVGRPGRQAFSDPFTLFPVGATAGGSAIQIDGMSTLRLTNSSVTGGVGGGGIGLTAVGCVAPQDGGHGVLLASGIGTNLVTIGTELSGGAAGQPADPLTAELTCPATAADGQAVRQLAGAGLAAIDKPISAASLVVPRVLSEGDGAQVRLDANAGEIGIWVIALAPSNALTGGPSMILQLAPEVDPNYTLIPFGTIGGSGFATLDIAPFGDALPVGSGVMVYQQAVSIDTLGVLQTGEFESTLLLDSVF